MVDGDGKNFYPTNAIWMTDGYGDYVRHYLRAMASNPQVSPEENHLLRTSSVIKKINYNNQSIDYIAFDDKGKELLRLKNKPASVKGANKWLWKSLDSGGVLSVSRKGDKHVTIAFN